MFHIVPQTGNGTTTIHEESDYPEEIDTPKTNHKPFFRRLSFKGLRRGKVLKAFYKTKPPAKQNATNMNNGIFSIQFTIIRHCSSDNIQMTPIYRAVDRAK